VFGFLLGEALRDLRRAGRVAVSAILLITLSLAALGAFWLLSSNMSEAVTQFRERVKLIVYLKREPSMVDANALVERVRTMPGVAAVRYVGKAEALGTLRQVLGKDAAVVDTLPQNPLPASLEITPTAEGATLDGARALVTRLAALPETEEVGGGVEWMERFAHGQRLLWLFALGVGAVLGVAAILTVTTATTLVLHARREEMEIMRLVGAPEHIVRLPLLLQGMMQGLLGAMFAIWVLVACYALVGPRLEPLVSETLGVARLTFLRPHNVVTLMLAGTLLGGVGGVLARGRPLET
jgi:cell division transport system permease protein